MNAAGASFFRNFEARGCSVKADYDFGWVNLTSISAYRQWTSVDINDADILPINILDGNAGKSAVQQTIQDLRLTLSVNRPFVLTLRLFYFDVADRGGNIQAGTVGQILPEARWWAGRGVADRH